MRVVKQGTASCRKAPVVKTSSSGLGLINSTINKLPFELHIPGYQYCGPGTKLQKRLLRGDPGINKLDAACREHDIAYSQFKDINKRHKADLILADKAWDRVKSTDANFGERAAAWTVTNAMKAKVKLGMGHSKKKRNNNNKKEMKKLFGAGVRDLRSIIRKNKPKSLKDAVKLALKAAKRIFIPRQFTTTTSPRIIPIPKTGGILPFLVPLFAGLSAVGSLAGGAAGVAKAISAAQAARKQLSENERHNKMMEAIALGASKRGTGLYIKPYRKGLGVYIESKNY